MESKEEKGTWIDESEAAAHHLELPEARELWDARRHGGEVVVGQQQDLQACQSRALGRKRGELVRA